MKDGWEYKKLGEVATLYDSQRKPVTKKDRKNGIYPYYGASGIQDYVDNYIFDGRYLLVGEDGAKWGANDKTAFIVEGKIWVNNHAHIMTFDDSVKDRFVEYYLVGKDLNEYITGAVVPKLTQASLSKIPIPIPPLAEQERIVAELDLLSSIIDKKKAQLKELDQLAQSIFYNMFGDPITNEKGWEVIQLGSKCEVSSFKRVLIEDVVDEGVPFIRGTELMTLSKGEKTSFTLFITQEHYEKVKNISGVPKIGDLLIPSINANGCIWILDTEEPRYYKDGRVLWVHVDEKSYSSQALKFIMHSLIKNTYSSVASGATFAELKLFVLRELNTILPPLPLQQEFASKIEAIERQKSLIQQSIVETQTLFDSRMDHWFG